METLKWLGSILLAILGLALVIGLGYAFVMVVLVLAAVAGGVFLIGFIAWCIREAFR